MLRNYLVIAIRNLKRNKLHTLINITGLTIGFTCFILISLWINDEFDYDRAHTNKDRIFQLTITHPTGIKDSNVPNMLPVLLANNYSEIENFTRVIKLSNKITCSFRFEDSNGEIKAFNEDNVVLVDTGFFSIFTYPFLKGKSENPLEQPNAVILNEETAKRYFGEEEAIGKKLTLNNQDNYIVTGIFNQTGKSHIDIDIIMPIPYREFNNWNWADPSYVITAENTDADQFREKIADFFNAQQPYNLQGNFVLDILPITKSYLSFGRMKYIYIFSTVAILTLLIGGINYVNLTYAGITKRLKEMMVRKSTGAHKSQLIFQIVLESVLICFVGLILSLIFIELILPTFNTVFNRSLQLDQYTLNLLFLFLLPLTVMFGVVTGIFPALLISGKNLFNKYRSTLKISRFRNYSVIGQFTVSIMLITCSLIIIKQINYVQNTSLGLDPSYIIKVPITQNLGPKLVAFKDELVKNPQILNMTYGQAVPFNENFKTGGINWKGKEPDLSPLFRYSITSDGFIETFGMNISRGRDFVADYPADKNNFIVNEEAVRYMGLENPIGETISFWNGTGEIIGVVEDFHHVSLHHEILPHIITINPMHYRSLKYVFIKISSNDIKSTLEYIQSVSETIVPDVPFEFSFIDQEIEELYRSEKKLAKVITYFSIFTLIICGLGVYGITAFLGEQRTKEIGIRKAFGATSFSIANLFNKKILSWVLFASLIAFPASYTLSLIWINNFTYKTPVSGWAIIISSLMALLVGLATSSMETLKAALKNPVTSLRYE